MVWAGAWLGSTLPTVYHRLVVGGENGHGCSYCGFRQLGGEVRGVTPINVHALDV